MPTRDKRKSVTFHIGHSFMDKFNYIHAAQVIKGVPVSKGHLIERAIELLVKHEERK
jgi:hypothetical protein